MRPLGRFFQVTEVGVYDKYLLDIEKVMHFPITFVVKTMKTKSEMEEELKAYIDERSGGMRVLQERYEKAIEEIITINELLEWVYSLDDENTKKLIGDMDFYYKLEMNVEA